MKIQREAWSGRLKNLHFIVRGGREVTWSPLTKIEITLATVWLKNSEARGSEIVISTRALALSHGPLRV